MSLGITACHHSASLVMPNGDPRDRFFYPTLILMIDFYILIQYAMENVGYHMSSKIISDINS